MVASGSGGTPPYNFTWHRWSEFTKSFSILLKSDSEVVNSTATDLEEGGYRITITGGYDTTLVAWIVFDEPPVAEAKLLNPDKSCFYVALDGTASATRASFPYYDIITGNQLTLKNEMTFLWSSYPESPIPAPDVAIDPITYKPPLDDVTYNLKVNTLGCSSEASFFYESIHVKADFSAEPTEGEAPLEITFTDNSVRGYNYLWRFGDDSVSNLADPGTHTYYIPGEYKATLIIESELTCSDSATVDITVLPSSLQIPNVFTPNDDGINDYFVPDKKSLKFLDLQVFAKSGHRVCHYRGDGEDLRDWQGWDGRINNSDRRATPGAYFYVIRAVGYDEVEYEGREYRGTLYLYR